MNPFYEVVVLCRGEGVPDDCHLALRSQGDGARHTCSAHGAISSLLQHECSGCLKTLIAGNKEDCSWHSQPLCAGEEVYSARANFTCTTSPEVKHCQVSYRL
jgi:hypothetical protein